MSYECMDVCCILFYWLITFSLIKSFQDQLVSQISYSILNSAWRKYIPALHEYEERANKLDKSNERRITDEVIADIKSKGDMPRRTNETLGAEFEDYVFQSSKTKKNK